MRFIAVLSLHLGKAGVVEPALVLSGCHRLLLVGESDAVLLQKKLGRLHLRLILHGDGFALVEVALRLESLIDDLEHFFGIILVPLIPVLALDVDKVVRLVGLTLRFILLYSVLFLSGLVQVFCRRTDIVV